MTLYVVRHGERVAVPRKVEAKGPKAVEKYVEKATKPKKKSKKGGDE